MKRVGHIYEQIVSVENCRRAIYSCAQGKRQRSSVQRIMENAEEYAVDLSNRLKNLTFISPYITRHIVDGLSKKERELQIPNFYPDQCAHHAIIQVLMPIIMKSSYYWSCGNIPNRGIDKACKGVERATVRDLKHAKYCVKCDIRKFYPSIPHDKLKSRFRAKIKDEKALQIIDAVIDSHPVGLPIGNYTSPWFAELFLQPLDWFIKQELGVRHYIRYADDMVLIGSNKRKLRKALYCIMNFVRGLGLELKGNYQLFRIYKDGKGRKIDFVGRCFGYGFTTIRKRNALAIMRQSRRIAKRFAKGLPISHRMAGGFLSRCGCFKYTKSFGLKRKYYDTLDIRRIKEVIRNESKRQRLASASGHGSSTGNGRVCLC